jgi:hypothetical protein
VDPLGKNLIVGYPLTPYLSAKAPLSVASTATNLTPLEK